MTLRRSVGGLGFSVAGGKGTMPYRVDDEVCACLKLLLATSNMMVQWHSGKA